jgi:hypothetical protein
MFVRGDISILVPYNFRSVVAILTAPAVESLWRNCQVIVYPPNKFATGLILQLAKGQPL